MGRWSQFPVRPAQPSAHRVAQARTPLKHRPIGRLRSALLTHRRWRRRGIATKSRNWRSGAPEAVGMNQSVGFSPLSSLLAALLLVSACSGSDGGAVGSLIDSCQGAYTCVVDGSIVDSGLVKTSAGRCYLGNLELAPDGTSPPIAGQTTTWSGDANRIEICQGPYCFSCYPSGPTSGAPGSGSPASGSGASGPASGSGASGPASGSGASGNPEPSRGPESGSSGSAPSDGPASGGNASSGGAAPDNAPAPENGPGAAGAPASNH